MSTIFIFILLLMIIFWQDKEIENFENKPYLWLYWESPKGKTMPDYVKLCIMLTIKKCSKRSNVILVNEKTLQAYLPDLRKDLKYPKVGLAQKADYIRYQLLYHYGGMWLDANTIVLRDLSDIYNKLDEYDYVGFGCTGTKCTDGYPFPSNWAMAARQGSRLMKRCIENADKILNKQSISDESNYHTIGKVNIWKSIQELKQEMDYEYHHFNDEYIGHRNREGYWVSPLLHLLKDPNSLFDMDKTYFIVLHGSMLTDEFKKKSTNEILNDQCIIGKLLQQELDMKN